MQMNKMLIDWRRNNARETDFNYSTACARDGLGRFCSRVKTSSVKNFIFYTININAAAENGYNLRPQGREC